MVEVGSLTITGKMDTSNIESGFRRVRQGFDNVQARSASTFGSFTRLGGAVRGVVGGLARIGAVGLGALGTLAAFSPTLAGTFANMKVAAIDLGNTAGQILKPGFEAIVAVMKSLDTALEKNQGNLRSFFEGIKGSTKGVLSALEGDFSGFADNISDVVASAVGATAGGLIAGPKGAIAGAAAGPGMMRRAERIAGETQRGVRSGEQGFFSGLSQNFSAIAPITTAIGAGAGSFIGGIGALPGAGAGLLGGGIAALIKTLVDLPVATNRARNRELEFRSGADSAPAVG